MANSRVMSDVFYRLFCDEPALSLMPDTRPDRQSGGPGAGSTVATSSDDGGKPQWPPMLLIVQEPVTPEELADVAYVVRRGREDGVLVVRGDICDVFQLVGGRWEILG